LAEHQSKVLIIGSGPAGYTAALYAARANLNPLLVRGMQPGGQMTITTDVENYPGFAEVIQGPWLMQQMEAQVLSVGTKLIEDLIVDVNIADQPFKAVGDSGDVYTADALIIATGAQARWLNIKGEDKFKGFGVSACATCDGFFYRGKKVAVVGGGNTAAEEALYLTNHAEEVILIHRRDKLRAEKILQDRVFSNPKINVIWNSVVEEIIGDLNPPSVKGIQLHSRDTGEKTFLPVDGFFVAIGHDPATKLFRNKIDMNEQGYILTANDSTLTSVRGVYAAGDVQDPIYRQAVTAAGTGCMAALEAEAFLAEFEDSDSISDQSTAK